MTFVPNGGVALAEFRELAELAVGDLEVVTGLRKLIDVGDPLFRGHINDSAAIGAGHIAFALEPSNGLHELLTAARIRARNREFDDIAKAAETAVVHG